LLLRQKPFALGKDREFVRARRHDVPWPIDESLQFLRVLAKPGAQLVTV
jgi:hypothetical protein